MKKNLISLSILSLLLAICFLSSATALRAQVSTANISGVISDSQGARVQGAKVVATNSETGVANTVASDSDGVYTIPALPIGTYRVEVQHEGFKSTARDSVVLSVGQSATEDFTLSVGDVAETVEVTASAPVVDTASSSVGWLVGAEQTRELPLNGRNYIQLTLLAPGVQPVPQENTEGASTLVPFGFGSPQRFSVAGGRPQGELFLIDGTDTAGVWGNGTGANLVGTTLGVDGIEEFQVLTDTYTADYGGNGAAVNAAIRSGTNSFHGSAYEFARNSAMDARNYFDPTPGPLPFSRNQFGGTFGGPIRHDQTFFFANYEGLRQSLTVPITTTVPDQNFRNGFLPCAETVGVVCNPTTGLADVGVNPNIKSYLDAYPLPNGANLGNGTALNTSPLDSPLFENYGVVRIDHNFSSSDSLFGSYTIDNATLTAHPDPVLTDADSQRNQYLSVEERKVISPTILNVAHFGYVRSNIDVDTLLNSALLVVPGSGIQGTINVIGLSVVGGNDTAKELVNRFTWRDQLSFVKGRHSIDVGFEVVRHYIDADIPIVNGGDVFYDPLGPESSFQAFLQDQALAFAGVPLGQNNSTRMMRHTNLSPYIQDKFQVSRRFVVNLGLRYDFETNPTEVHDQLYNLVNPITDTGFTHVPRAFEHNPTRYNLEPRVGFAWDVFGNQKTSLRGGFGAFADLPLEMQVQIAYLFNPPIYNVTTILFPTIPNPFSGGGVNATGLPGGAQLSAYNTNMNDYIMEYNLNVQQQVFRNTVLTVGYLGSRANHLYIGQETNPCLPTSVEPDGTIVRAYANATACTPVNPHLSNVVMRYPVGTSNYNSLQVALDKGLGKLVQFRTAYTYSKCLDYGSYYTGNDSIGPDGQTFGLQAGNLANVHRNVDYGPCDYDLRNNWTSNIIFQLPFHGNRIKDGWQVMGISSIHSGTPYSAYDAIDQANIGAGGAADNAERPDVIGSNANPTFIRKTSSGVYGFNPNVFTLQPAGVFGDLGRNTLTAPGVREVDLGVAKTTKISERTALQLRLDVFNVANHTNFSFPDAALFNGVTSTGVALRNPAAGLITSTSTTSRQLQLSARFTF
jgi:Carboxypeptidase regulatory-like domain/TonB-dependent Receptor Plug Domain